MDEHRSKGVTKTRLASSITLHLASFRTADLIFAELNV